MAITQDKLFSDAMQITRRQGTSEDADGIIVDTSSAIWTSCLGIACQELTKDLMPLVQSETGSTSSTTIYRSTFQEIDIPEDFIAVKSLMVDGKILSNIGYSELQLYPKIAYGIEDDKIYINSSTISEYILKYFQSWPNTSGTPSTDLSSLSDKYYLCLLWQTIKQIYLFYEEMQGANVASGMYNSCKENISGTTITYCNNYTTIR